MGPARKEKKGKTGKEKEKRAWGGAEGNGGHGGAGDTVRARDGTSIVRLLIIGSFVTVGGEVIELKKRSILLK